MEPKMDTELETKMETMEEPKKLGLVARIRNHRGFSLVEMAIVLVIIGIIIAAIVKGQDLILNANAKKVISATSTWRNLSLTFMDRNGRYPGDQNKNGIIGDQDGTGGAQGTITEQSAANDAIGEIAAVMQDTPPNPVVVGSSSFWIYLGSTTNTTGAHNAILICGNSACTSVFSADQLEIIKAMDTAFDGSADAGLGQFRSESTAPANTGLVPAYSLVNNRANASFSGDTIVSDVNTVAGSATVWNSTAVTGNKGAVWLFDKPY